MTALENLFLCSRNQFDRNIPRQISTIDQQRIRTGGDVIQICETGPGFNFRYDEGVRSGEFPDQIDIVRVIGEGQRKMRQAEFDYLKSSTAAQQSFAENYVGLPF